MNNNQVEKHQAFFQELQIKVTKLRPLLQRIERREAVIQERVELEYLQMNPERLNNRGPHAREERKREEAMAAHVRNLDKLTLDVSGLHLVIQFHFILSLLYHILFMVLVIIYYYLFLCVFLPPDRFWSACVGGGGRRPAVLGRAVPCARGGAGSALHLAARRVAGLSKSWQSSGQQQAPSRGRKEERPVRLAQQQRYPLRQLDKQTG